MNTVWILVCDAAQARLFETHADDAKWKLLQSAHHEDSRKKAADLVTGEESGSRAPQGGGTHHNALSPSSSPKENEKDHFAHQLVNVLDQGMRSHAFDRWVLVAPPHFVGMVKKCLTKELEKHLMSVVDKDLVHFSVDELKTRLQTAAEIPLDQRDVVRPSVRVNH